MLSVSHRGNFNKTERFFAAMKRDDIFRALDAYGRAGVEALAAFTPVDSGITASSWNYEIVKERGRYLVRWTNSSINQGVNIAIILQYGHGTGTGGYVQGRDYINPAMQPIFDVLTEEVWKAVTSA